ncbi:MAG TPA: hypothetical protein VKY65_18910 [Alphaproteobacteria bacterium]|nr:hypothetical protein [Alphaproteobacteria bacterium]
MGAGPGGTGPLVWAAQNGKLASWLAAGVTILDRSPSMGGSLGRYIVNSDSLGSSYLECLDALPARELFARLRADAVTRELQSMRYGFPPLSLVGEFFRRFGAALEEIVSSHPGSAFLPSTSVRVLRLRDGGAVVAEVVTASGEISFIEARTAIMALGGRQDAARYLTVDLMPGVQLGDTDPDKILPSDKLLSTDGPARALAIFERAASRRVVILGGSHSAFSAAWMLTHRLPQVAFGPGDISILFRRPPRIFYWTGEDAAADGYQFNERDLCVRTRRVHRFGGLRGDGREMWRRLTRRPGTQPESRVTMAPLAESHFSPASLRRLLDEAALVIPAFGYRAATVPMFDATGRRLRLNADYGGPAVGRAARLLLAEGGELPNVFGIGLGADYRPWGHMGGEPSFDGQANSLWLYQNDIGEVVYRGVQDCLRQAARPPISRYLTASVA